MSVKLNADTTTPETAAQLSADRNEIVHIRCHDAQERKTYEEALCVLLDDADSFGGGAAPLEVIGYTGNAQVRVHLDLT